VYFCDEVYEKANGDFDKWLAANGYPVSSHAGIPDTSEMMYLGGDKGWTRPAELPNAVGDPVRQRGTPADPNAKRVNNGISGDARRSTVELGKKIFDMKVDYAVRQIQGFLAGQAKTPAQ
jgi:creatinine amidohydrolase/Fe(II)-dependent formamide hydrolase-like protein